MNNNLPVVEETEATTAEFQHSLEHLIETCKWDCVMERLKTERGKKEASKTACDNWCPIHGACVWEDVPLKVISALLESYPQGIQQKTELGFLPIHYAARSSCSVDAIQILIGAYPEGLQQQNSYGQLPIHLAARSNLSTNVMTQLIGAYPDGLQHRDVNGRLPIHYTVLSTYPSFDIIKMLIKSSPMSIILSCPYHVAVQDKGKGGDTKEVEVLDEAEGNFFTSRRTKTETKHLMPSVLLSYVGKYRYLSRLERLADLIRYLESKEQAYIFDLAFAALEQNGIKKNQGSTTKK